MGAITALGSVSVALALCKLLSRRYHQAHLCYCDTDARVRYYVTAYTAKIARGEILVHFNQVFDILCILVTDTESLVKNAADI